MESLCVVTQDARHAGRAPRSRRVVGVRAEGEMRYGADQTLAEAAELPGLAPRVAELFVQLSQ